MGYTTDFEGRFTVTPTLTPERRAYLHKFSRTRRMQRDPLRTATMPDPEREAVGLPVGPEGAYFVGAPGYYGQDATPDVVDQNLEPSGQPGLWCKWVPTEDGTAIEWNGAEKFYDYEAWLKYIVEHFLRPWGHVLNGGVAWQGEDAADAGALICKNNEVISVKGRKAAKQAKEGRFG